MVRKLNKDTWSQYEQFKHEKLQIEPAEAELKLALLKENFLYRQFYEELKKDPYSKIPELIHADESFKDFKDRLHNIWDTDGPYFSDWLKKTGDMGNLRIRRGFVFRAFYNRPEELTEFLDPSKRIQHKVYPPDEDPEEIATIENFFYERVLPELFSPEGITLLTTTSSGLKIGFSWEFPVVGATAGLRLQPYERLLKIDFSKRKSELLRQFEAFIDTMEKMQQNYQGRDRKKRGYDAWAPDYSRQTDEIRTQIAIWKMRKERKSFAFIAEELKITEDLAKKHFYRAFELTQQKRYDKDLYKRNNVIRISDLSKSCKNCLDNPEKGGKCKEICPDVMYYVKQDKISQKDRRFSDMGKKHDKEPFNPDKLAVESYYSSATSRQSSDLVYGKHKAPISLFDEEQKPGPVKIIFKKQ